LRSLSVRALLARWDCDAMWSRSRVGLFLLLPGVLLKKIQLTCKSSDRPFCGTYQLRDNLWSGEEVFEMSKDSRVFQILKDTKTDEHCVSLRQRIKLCGNPSSDVMVRVKDGQRTVQAGFALIFDMPGCMVDDLYNDCESDVTEESSQVEISGGVAASPNSFPFMVRLHIQGARGREGTCGGSLIHEKFFLSSLHCFSNEGFDFWKHCFRRGSTNNRCYAVVREHFIDSADLGEVRINILSIYGTSDSSDLVVGELERPVALDSKAQIVAVSSKPLESGDLVTTAGWGLYGPTGHLSNVLRRTELEVSVGGEEETVKTKVGRTRSGIPVDACSGDSGGPLLKWSDNFDAFVLHATLNGGGYDCVLNTTDGDGVWNSVFPHTKWINSFVKGFTPAQEDMEPDVPLPPAPTGKIVLQHSSSLIGDILYEGSVFLDGKPVCDNAWGHNEALVACRIFGYNRAVARTNSHFGGVEEGTEFAISDLRCKGDESHLLHCPHTALRSCGIAEVAGVTCILNESDSPTKTATATRTATAKTTTTFKSTTTISLTSAATTTKATGTWSSWGSWTSCTKSCGQAGDVGLGGRGRSHRQRSCSGGSACPGDRSEGKWCNTITCPEVSVSQGREKPRRIDLTREQEAYCQNLAREQLLTCFGCCCQCSGQAPKSCFLRRGGHISPFQSTQCA